LELEFREVNLFLKSNGRKLLDNISGTLKPGRVTAVMVRGLRQ
jgi:ABC-type hemin transport system ATPase subunit